MPKYRVTAPDGTAYLIESDTPLNHQQRIARVQRLQEEQTYDPTAGMGRTEKVFANIGAGMSNLLQGGKQLIDKLPGTQTLDDISGVPGRVTDEDIREKRARDARLAESTTGGKALQIAGEVVPTFAIPASRATSAGSLLTRALGGSGRAVAEGAAVGAGTGALQPVTSDESRAANVALGGVAGAAIPAAVSGVRAGRRYLTTPGVKERATEQLIEAVGGPQEAAQAVQAVTSRKPSAVTQEVPLKFSQAAQSPQAARLELAQRGSDPDLWVAHELQQNQRLYEAMEHATQSAPQVTGREAARDAATAPLREAALEMARRSGGDITAPLQAEIARLKTASLTSPEHRVAEAMERDLAHGAKAGTITPEYVYKMRKNLMNMYESKFASDEATAAVKGAGRETSALRDAIDAGLDQASGRQWRSYLDTYSTHSRGVTSAKTQQEIRELVAPPGGPLVGKTPHVTRSILKTALGPRGERLEDMSPAARKRLEEVIRTATEIEEPIRTLKLAGTGGGGSQTAMQQGIMKAGKAAATVVPHGVVVVTEAAKKKSDEVLSREINTLLLNPTMAAAQIQAKLSRSQPLTLVEYEAAKLMRMAGVTGGVLLGKSLQTPDQRREAR